MKKRKQSLKRALTGFLAAALVASLLPVSALAADDDSTGSAVTGSVEVYGVTYNYATASADGYTQIGETSVYYAVADGGTALSGTLYGTASLEYADYYAGDVTDGYTYDAVTTATVADYSMFTNAYTDYDEETSTDGYDILGVSNVDIAVDAATYAEAEILEAADALPDEGVYTEAAAITLNEDAETTPTSYKTLNSDGSYSAFTYADDAVTTITDATPNFTTNGAWGEYEIDLEEDSTLYLRNSRSDTYTDDDGNTQTYAVGSNITGLILTAEDSEGNETSVGLAYLANIWIQPYKLSWNAVDTTATKNIAYSGATDKYEAISGKTVTTITYLTADGKYVYELGENSVYVKPAYTGTVSGSFNDDVTTFTLDADTVPEMENAQMTINYCVPGTRGSTDYALYSGDVVTTEITLDTSVIPEDDGYYEVTITSDTYADITVAYALLDSQIESLESLIYTGKYILSTTEDSTLTAHVSEALGLLADADTSGPAAVDLIDELTELIEAYDAVDLTVTSFDTYYKHAVTTNFATYFGDSAGVIANSDGTYSVVFVFDATNAMLSDVAAAFDDYTYTETEDDEGYITYVLTMDDITKTIDFTFSYTVTVMSMTHTYPFQIVLDGGTYTMHELTYVEAVDATETEDGNIAYYTCETCGTYYSDAEGTTEISSDDIVIAATGEEESITLDAGTYTVPVSLDFTVSAMGVDFGEMLSENATVVVNEDGSATITLDFTTMTIMNTYVAWVGDVYGIVDDDGNVVSTDLSTTTTTITDENSTEQTAVASAIFTVSSIESTYSLSYYLSSNMMSGSYAKTLTVDWDNAEAVTADNDADEDNNTDDGTDSNTSDGTDNNTTGGTDNNTTVGNTQTQQTQTITVKNNKKTIKAKKLKKKKASFKLKATVSGNAKVTYKKLNKKTSKALKKGYKALKISKNGKVTVKKGTAKGTYKIKVKVTAKATSAYKAATKTITVTVKVK